MALISDTKGRKDPSTSAYFRVFAEDESDIVALKLASLVSKIHATTIRNGCKLDGSILSSPTYNPNSPFPGGTITGDLRLGHFTKLEVYKKDCPAIVGQERIQVDYVVVGPACITLFEIKDGDAFDTKKSKGEINSLKTIQAHFKYLHPEKDVLYHIVLWNASVVDPTSIKVNNMEKGVVITGAEFCSKTNIDYDAINRARRTEASKANKDYVKEQLLKIFDD